jgi:hypothetical protein
MGQSANPTVTIVALVAVAIVTTILMAVTAGPT